MVLQREKNALPLVIHPPVTPPRPQAQPDVRPMSILAKKRNRFEVVAMVDARQEDERWVLQPIGAVGLTIAPEMIAQAVWVQHIHETNGYHVTFTHVALPCKHSNADLLWK